MRDKIRRAGLVNLTMLAREIGKRLSSERARVPGRPRALFLAAEKAWFGIATGSMDFGNLARLLVTAAESHVREMQAPGRTMRESDARLGRALAVYLHREALLLRAAFAECVPAQVADDLSLFRADMAAGLVAAGFLCEGRDGEAMRAYVWTRRGRELADFPPPLAPDDSRVQRKDFADLYASG